MFCRYCGAKLPDDSRFCSLCGRPTGFEEVNRQPEPQAQTYRQQPYEQPAYQQQYEPPVTGELLCEADKVTRYNGGGAIGPVTGTGVLSVYDDRIEFFKKTGDQRGYMFGPIIGGVMNMSDPKKNQIEVYEYQDIARVGTGKYAGVMATLVLQLRNGKKVSFTMGKGGAPLAQEMCDLIAERI